MGPVDLFFTRQEVEGGPRRWMSQARVAVTTAWTELVVPSLRFEGEWRADKDGVTMVVEPPTMTPSEKGDYWQISLEFSGFSNVSTEVVRSVSLGDIRVRLENGQRISSLGGGGSAQRRTFRLSVPAGTDPETTPLTARVPTRITVIEVPLELYNASGARVTSQGP